VEVPPMTLTARQKEIADLLFQGLNNKEIGRALNIAHGTVKVHLCEMYRRYGVNSRGKLLHKLGRGA
jgi:two-component system nitrate/nitrite response regulator NarL